MHVFCILDVCTLQSMLQLHHLLLQDQPFLPPQHLQKLEMVQRGLVSKVRILVMPNCLLFYPPPLHLMIIYAAWRLSKDLRRDGKRQDKEKCIKLLNCWSYQVALDRPVRRQPHRLTYIHWDKQLQREEVELKQLLAVKLNLLPRYLPDHKPLSILANLPRRQVQDQNPYKPPCFR